jgi:hypothetical protein
MTDESNATIDSSNLASAGDGPINVVLNNVVNANRAVRFSIDGTVNTLGGMYVDNANTGMRVGHNSSTLPLFFTTNDTDRIRIAADGTISFLSNVSFGPTTYNGTLTVSNAAPTIQLQETDVVGGNTFLLQDGNLFSIRRGTIGAVDALTIDASNNVGIGKVPSVKLDVNGVIRSSDNCEFSADSFLYSFNGGAAGQVRSGIQMLGFSQALSFLTAGSERMRITSGGSVGINTSNPTDALHVIGNGRFSSSVISPIGTFSGSVSSGQIFANTSLNGYAIDGRSTNTLNGSGGVVGFSPNTSIYGILGYRLGVDHSFYGNGTLFNGGAGQFTGALSAASASLTGSVTATYVNSSSAVLGQYGVDGRTTNGTTGGGVIGFSSSTSIYGILGYNGGGIFYSFYGQGISYNIGEIRGTGNIIAYFSDRRLKKDIERYTGWRKVIEGVNAYTFGWNENGQKLTNNSDEFREIGFIAQEVEAVHPEGVADQLEPPKEFGVPYDENDPYKTVRPEKLLPVYHEAIKYLLNKVEELEARLKELS